ncbi:hypothetical protein DDE82_008511 [Stemphylium lycopersici]|nr:hypothetical protein TW65_00658 [Stemphylium lycopersici]RAQ99186.1 hypothetical protein DDE82_008511 [Stemphylium lycopersici]
MAWLTKGSSPSLTLLNVEANPVKHINMWHIGDPSPQRSALMHSTLVLTPHTAEDHVSDKGWRGTCTPGRYLGRRIKGGRYEFPTVRLRQELLYGRVVPPGQDQESGKQQGLSVRSHFSYAPDELS